jgi:hypothetical protein
MHFDINPPLYVTKPLLHIDNNQSLEVHHLPVDVPVSLFCKDTVAASDIAITV